MRNLFLLTLTTLLLGACASQPDLHFWRQNDTASALYLNGPKAQQQLEVDIAACVHEIVEIAKIEAVREGTPPLALGELGTVEHSDLQARLSRLPYWETPDYIRDLRVNHTDYHDFESCMRYKGWERAMYVHPEAGVKSLDVYKMTREYFEDTRQKKSYHIDHEVKSGTYNN